MGSTKYNYKQIKRDPYTDSVYSSICANAAHNNEKIQYSLIERLCGNIDEVANFYTHIRLYGLTIAGEIPQNIKKALFEYDIDVDSDKKKGAI